MNYTKEEWFKEASYQLSFLFEFEEHFIVPDARTLNVFSAKNILEFGHGLLAVGIPCLQTWGGCQLYKGSAKVPPIESCFILVIKQENAGWDSISVGKKTFDNTTKIKKADLKLACDYNEKDNVNLVFRKNLTKQ